MLARSHGLERLPKKAAARLDVDHPKPFLASTKPSRVPQFWQTAKLVTVVISDHMQLSLRFN
jgi:hypothetical protein